MRTSFARTGISDTTHAGVSRRDLLTLLLAGGTMAALAPLAHAAASSTDTRFAKLLADFAEEILVLVPTTATSLGKDDGARSALKSQLEDASPAGDAAWSAQVHAMAKRLAALERKRLSPASQIRYDTVLYSTRAGIAGERFAFGGAASGFFGGTSPYPVTQQGGALVSVPEFLDSQHSIANAADAEAYLARLVALGRVLDQESARITAQAADGVIPPAFIAATTLKQLKAFRATPAAEQKLVTSVASRTATLGIPGDWEVRALKLVTDIVYPALDRQIAAFSQATAKASDVAGVHKLPNGAAYYAWALKLGTTTDYTPAEIHAVGLAQVKQLQGRIDGILRAQGKTQGTVGERIAALARDPSMLYPDTDAGRAQIIAFCNSRVDAIRAIMPKISHLTLKAPLEIKRVPSDIEAGAALGYMNFASLDGKRPAIYYINLKSTGYWPRTNLSTLTAHEGIPGHAWQGAYIAEHQAELPLIASLTGYNAFIEGWALYAEQLVDEFGLYADDPFSQVGYLQGQLFRACRLVVDTGLHALQWPRQQAIDFMVANAGSVVAGATSEVDRYIVSPGQACGYKMGHIEILKQRDRARTALGKQFDLAGFNDALVASAGVPLAVLPTVIDRYIAAGRGR
ncbi:DUF885 domain-containing protein [Massilia sp. S19_KUP03_FR1]|uniref:DUF885 domain-containing protein n=1 Tax=Massilia sp. S19_KUP03_FR1 TaxID=3025503 RepID=UPI002FCDD475